MGILIILVNGVSQKAANLQSMKIGRNARTFQDIKEEEDKHENLD